MAEFIKITETPSHYDDLEQMDVFEIISNINREDHKVAEAVKEVIPQIAKLVDAAEQRFYDGGRLFYIGAGTSGRLGILDASEIPPTFGMPHTHVIGLIAGGDSAIRKAVEFAEDDTNQAWLDLKAYDINERDTLIGIAASGTGNVEAAKKVGTAIAELAKQKNIEEVVFNRNGFLYHGRVKALAEAAREAGLKL